MLGTVSDGVKQDVSIFIDGIRFVRVRFIDCQLIYKATADIDFVDCIFEGCEWTFDDAAARMLGFLATVYEKTSPIGQELVEGIFDSIRDKRITQFRAEVRSDLKADAVVMAKSA